MQEPPAAILEFLREIGAAGVAHHGGRTLETHLIATWRVLTGWGVSQEVAIAGLCHSVYGTDTFETACLGTADRPRVEAAIGKQAERLAFLYGAMIWDRFLANPAAPQLESRFGPPEPVNEDERTALAHILLANELDNVIAKKRQNRPDKVAKKVGPFFDALNPWLNEKAVAAYRLASAMPE